MEYMQLRLACDVFKWTFRFMGYMQLRLACDVFKWTFRFMGYKQLRLACGVFKKTFRFMGYTQLRIHVTCISKCFRSLLTHLIDIDVAQMKTEKQYYIKKANAVRLLHYWKLIWKKKTMQRTALHHRITMRSSEEPMTFRTIQFLLWTKPFFYFFTLYSYTEQVMFKETKPYLIWFCWWYKKLAAIEWKKKKKERKLKPRRKK